MSSRCVIRLIVTLLSFGSPVTAAPPNVLMIVSDDQAWTDYGFMGHSQIRTPHLDRLASESALFTRGYVPTSLCRPSLATLMTGLYPHQHGTTANDPDISPMKKSQRNPEYLRLNRGYIDHFARQEPLPRLLGEHGYASLQTGKWWEGNYAIGGFDEGMTHGDPERGGRHGDAGLTIGREGLQPVFDFIAAHEANPWFVWYAPFLPHSPHTPPDRLFEKYRGEGVSDHVARYYAMCEWFDETCGELLDYLKTHGLEQNTLVVYVADNGWIQDPDSPRYAPRSKRSPNEGGIRTPIMLRWPGHIAPARYDDTLASSIDLFPTIAAAAEVSPTTALPGINLLDVCRADGRCDRDTIYGEIFEHDMPDIDDPAAGLMFRWVISDDWKLIAPADSQTPPELYDLTADPHEDHDLAANHSDVVTQLQTKLDNWWNPQRN